MSDALPPGTQLRLEYDDHNELFAEQLPRVATVVRRVAARHGVDNWYLVDMDRPVAWEERHHSRLLVRSRWRDHPLGGTRPTSVFVLLVDDGADLPTQPIDPHAFFHVAWGMASRFTSPD